MSSDSRFNGLASRLRLAALALASAAASHVYAAPPTYVLTDLGDLVGNATIFTSHGSKGYGVNNAGQVAGSSSTVLPNGNGGPVHAFLWTPDVVNGTTGNMIDVSPSSTGIDDGDAVHINRYGQVLFTDGSALPGVQRQPVLWTPATPNGPAGNATPLVGVTSDGFGLNDLGQVVGRMFPGLCFAWTPMQSNGVAGSINHHFDSGRQQDIPGYGFGACTSAVGINNVGQVTGTVGVGFWSRPFIHANNPVPFPNVGPLELGSIDLGEIIGPGPNLDPNDQAWSGGGIAINDKGHVAGSTVFPGVGVHPFYFDGTALRDIAPSAAVPGTAYGMNNADQVVGQTAFLTQGGGAFLYDRGTTYQLLTLVEPASAQGWSALTGAYAINESGQIVGEGVHNGQGRAFLATPLVTSPSVCATDVTAQVQVAFSGFKRAGNTTNFWQVAKMTNIGGTSLTGPLSLVIDNISPNQSLANATGSTACTTPVGQPFVTSVGSLNPGDSVSVMLLFSDPSVAPIGYSGWHVLAGPNVR